jgi:hypothetical protein
MPGYPVLRSWQVIRLAARPVPAAASSFERFLIEQGQPHVDRRFSAVAQALPFAEATPRVDRSATDAPAAPC